LSRLAALYRDRADVQRRLAEIDGEIALEHAEPEASAKPKRVKPRHVRAAVHRAPARPVDPALQAQVDADLARMGYRTGT
jgi:hypothetical protein